MKKPKGDPYSGFFVYRCGFVCDGIQLFHVYDDWLSFKMHNNEEICDILKYFLSFLE